MSGWEDVVLFPLFVGIAGAALIALGVLCAHYAVWLWGVT